ncbi:MAG: DUF1493 family protein [Mixta sp.]
MKNDNVAQAVFELVEEYNGYWFWLRKRYPLKEETDLNADFKMAPEDAAELLESYAEKFAIDPQTINFGKFFPPDMDKKHVPLTIGMLIESARAGRWLY